MKGFIIAGTNSGCGKTTLTLGLMSLLAKNGHEIAPFKTGPDFIDPAFHEHVTGVPSYNLDTFLMPPDIVRHLYTKHTHKGKLTIVEGVMGMFDGLGADAQGSTAELAKELGLPVLLVINCKSMYQSVAAIVSGFANIDRSVAVRGVFLNNVPNADSYLFLKQYIEERTGIPCIGYLPHSASITLESRHLGLIQAQETETLKEKVAELHTLLEKTTDIHRLLAIASSARKMAHTPDAMSAWDRSLKGLHLAYAWDKAFSFYYRDNLDILLENGAKLLPFSPLTDARIPHEANALYLGGGYPEVFAEALAANKPMLESIKTAAFAGMPMYAECGGLMYLTKGIENLDGSFHSFCGVYQGYTKMQKRLQNFGYCHINWNGTVVKAHEFHHSTVEWPGSNAPAPHLFQIRKPGKVKEWNGGLFNYQTLAGYPHVHFGSSPTFYHKIIDLWTQRTT